MKQLLLLLALAAPAHAWPNSGATFTLTVPPGKHLASMSSNPLVHPLWGLFECLSGI